MFYQNINTVRVLVTNVLFGLIAFCGEAYNLQKLVIALAITVGVSILINLILVITTRIKYFNREISRKEVVPPFWKL